MSTITDPDGTVHLPIPPKLRGGMVRVTATFAPASLCSPEGPDALRGFGCLRGKIVLGPDFDEPPVDFKAYLE